MQIVLILLLLTSLKQQEGSSVPFSVAKCFSKFMNQIGQTSSLGPLFNDEKLRIVVLSPPSPKNTPSVSNLTSLDTLLIFIYTESERMNQGLKWSFIFSGWVDEYFTVLTKLLVRLIRNLSISLVQINYVYDTYVPISSKLIMAQELAPLINSLLEFKLS